MPSDHYYKTRTRKGVYSLISSFVRGVSVEFEVAPGLFSYREVDEGTRLLLEYAQIPEVGTVLDMGCGYGVIGIVIAKLNPKLEVYMVDINKDAVEISRRNVIRNACDPNKVKILYGNLYEPVKGIKFNAIYSNPPFSAGMEIVEKIILEAPDYLLPGGSLQVVVRKGAEKIHQMMIRSFGYVEKLASKRGYKVLLARKQS
ncbi:MAG: methyltransferase [Ignisphaera sp.]|uniref:Class I SAM-dependent methyltransferase n=1 Tax=Ignisphaera aggregans TaxID=334771 RepID=A0A7C4NNR4_9CREN